MIAHFIKEVFFIKLRQVLKSNDDKSDILQVSVEKIEDDI